MNNTENKNAKELSDEINQMGRKKDLVSEVYRRLGDKMNGLSLAAIEEQVGETLHAMNETSLTIEEISSIAYQIYHRAVAKTNSNAQLAAVTDWRWHVDKILGGVYNTLTAIAITAVGAAVYNKLQGSQPEEETLDPADTVEAASRENPFADTTAATPRPTRLRKADVSMMNA